MRQGIVILLSGCGVDYDLRGSEAGVVFGSQVFAPGVETGLIGCEIVGPYALCGDLVPYEDAAIGCFELGGSLANVLNSPDPYLTQQVLAIFGGEAFFGREWWVDWPDLYTCPAMMHLGSSSPRDCLESLPYACEFGGDGG